MPTATTAPRKPKKSKMSPTPVPEVPPLPKSDGPNMMVIEQVPLAEINRPKDNHRLAAASEDGELRGLAASMAADGLINPVQICRATDGSGYEIVAGARRVCAALMLGWKAIPATIVEAGQRRQNRAAENLQRRDLNPIEESIAVADLMAEVQDDLCKASGVVPESAAAIDTLRRAATKAVAARLGKTEAWVRDRNFLGTLDKVSRELVIGGRLPMEHARELVKIADPEKRADLAKLAAVGGRNGRHAEQPMLISELRGEVAKHIRSLAQVAWPLDKEFAGAPACTNCPSNSANQTGLFEDGRVQWGTSRHERATSQEPAAGVCTNAACYGRKSAAAARAIGTGCKRVTATINGLPVKARDEKAVAAAIKQHQPEIVTGAAFAREVKAHRERHAGGKSNGDGGKAKSEKRAETPEAKAKRDFERARDEWEGALLGAALKGIEKSPRLRIMLFLVDRTRAASEAKDWWGRVSPKAVKKVCELLTLACEPNWTNFCKLAEAEFSRYFAADLFDGLHGEAVEHLAGLLDVRPKTPRPNIEDFLPKARPEPAKPAAAAAKASRTKKGGWTEARSCPRCGKGFKKGDVYTVPQGTNNPWHMACWLDRDKPLPDPKGKNAEGEVAE